MRGSQHAQTPDHSCRTTRPGRAGSWPVHASSFAPTVRPAGSIAATRDGDLLALLHLLDRELGLGEPSGRLYADSLAFALLARAVALSSHHARTLSFDASPLNVRAQERLFEFVEENLHRNLGSRISPYRSATVEGIF